MTAVRFPSSVKASVYLEHPAQPPWDERWMQHPDERRGPSHPAHRSRSQPRPNPLPPPQPPERTERREGVGRDDRRPPGKYPRSWSAGATGRDGGRRPRAGGRRRPTATATTVLGGSRRLMSRASRTLRGKWRGRGKGRRGDDVFQPRQCSLFKLKTN